MMLCKPANHWSVRKIIRNHLPAPSLKMEIRPITDSLPIILERSINPLWYVLETHYITDPPTTTTGASHMIICTMPVWILAVRTWTQWFWQSESQRVSRYCHLCLTCTANMSLALHSGPVQPVSQQGVRARPVHSFLYPQSLPRRPFCISWAPLLCHTGNTAVWPLS